ncbi:MAG: hypothetical protein AB1451_11180, partial [Nitrospirota bacterium]
HPITVWAGVILLRLYFEVVGLRPQLTAVLGGFGKRSNNQIPAQRTGKRSFGSSLMWSSRTTTGFLCMRFG